MKAIFWFFAAAAVFCLAAPLLASEPVTLDNLVEPEANSADEPLAPRFSMERAADFLDSASLNWQRTWKCFTCHTNVSYLMARPLVSSSAPAHLEVRRFAEEQITKTWKDKGPHSDAEVVALATALAINDAATTGHLHPLTREALDRMWTLQRKTGEWEMADQMPLAADGIRHSLRRC